MSRLVCSLVLLAAALLTGCGTPSVHPVYSKDKEATDAALVGAWKPTDGSDKTIYTVSREGGAYRLVATAEGDKPERYEFEVRLVQLGTFRFADVAASESDRKKLDEQWGTFFLPTHM